jgi:hypothetical protein
VAREASKVVESQLFADVSFYCTNGGFQKRTMDRSTRISGSFFGNSTALVGSQSSCGIRMVK